MVNTATVSANGDIDTSNNRAVDAATVLVADVDIDKRHTGGPFVVGENGAYQVIVHNLNNVATASEITVRDTLPAGLTFVEGSGTGWSVTESAGIVMATYSNALAANDSAAFSLTVGVGAAAYPGVTNAASVSLADDGNPANDRDVDTVAVDTVAVPTPMDLSITKQHLGQFTIGEEGTYRIIVRNTGQSPTVGVMTVTDTLPPGITFVSSSGAGWGVSVSGQVVTATNSTVLAYPYTTSILTLVVAVGLSAYPSVTNAASVSTPGDPNEANDRDFDTAAVEGPPDLAVEKHHIGSFVVGGTASYVITIRNVGMGRSQYPVFLEDAIPSSLHGWTAHGDGWSLSGLGGSTLSGSYPSDIAVGDSTTVFITGFTILPSAYPTVTNGAAIHGVPNDVNSANDSATDVAEVTLNRPDLAIDMRHTEDFTAGQLATYTIVVTNVGAYPTEGVIGVRDTLPFGLVFASGTGSQWTVSAEWQVVSLGYFGPLAVGDSAVVNLTVAVSRYAVPSTTNRATVYGAGDTNVVNDVAEDVATVYPGVGAVPSIDRLAVESVSPNPLRGVARVTFNVPKRAQVRISVVDVQGREVAIVADGERAAGRPRVDARRPRVARRSLLRATAGQRRRYQAANRRRSLNPGDTVKTRSSWLAGLALLALATPAWATVTGVDLAVQKVREGALPAGSVATYHITVENLGTDPTSGTVFVRDTLPPTLSYNLATGSGWTVTVSGPRVTARYVAHIAPGDVVGFDLYAVIEGAPGALVVNSATVSATGDVNPSNDRSTDSAQVIFNEPDLALNKQHVDPFVAGHIGTYSLIVSNLGGGPTQGATTVIDTLPPGLGFSSASGAGWSIFHDGGIVTGIYPNPLALGESVGFNLMVIVEPTVALSVTNAATVYAAGDVEPGNDRDVDVATVIGISDVTISKRHTGLFAVGLDGIYTLVVTNVSNVATAQNIVVTDFLPNGLSYVSASGAGWNFNPGPNYVIAEFTAALAPGDSARFTLITHVGPAAFPGVSNLATVTVPGEEITSNNSAADFTAIIGVPDLTIDKRHTALFDLGGTGTYRFVVRNVGTAATSAIASVIDTLPTGLTFVSGGGTGWTVGESGGIVTATYPTVLGVGDSAIFTITVANGPAAYPAVTNRATVSLPGDANPSNDVDVDPTAMAVPDLAIDKRHTTAFVVGSIGLYRIVVRNVGGAATTAATTVLDTLPDGLSFFSASGVNWTADTTGDVVTLTYPNLLAPTESTFVNLTVVVGDEAYPSVVNAATVSTAGDSALANNRDVDPTAIGRPDLTIDKRHTVQFAAGVNASYRIVVRNVGNGRALAGATVRDTLPSGLGMVSLSGTLWSFNQTGPVLVATYGSILAAGDSTFFIYTVSVAAAAIPSVTNAATVSHIADINPANDRDVDPTTVRGPDLSIDKRHTTAFGIGVNGTYRVVVRNISTGPTLGAITVRDTLPAGLAYVAGSGTGWSVAESGGIVTATDANVIAGGDSAFFTLTVSVAEAAYPAVTNAASVSTFGDANPANDRDVDPTAVAGLDLTIDKRHTAPFVLGLNAIYRIVVRNPSAAATTAATTVRDTLPPGLSYVDASGNGWSMSELGGIVTATFPGVIARNDSAVFTLTVAVGPAAYPSVTNAASVSNPGDVGAFNDRDLDPTAVGGLPDLTLDKRHVGSFEAGRTASYLFVIRNVGTNPSLAVATVTDTLPPGLAYFGISGDGWTATTSGPVVTATYPKVIAAGDSAIGVFTVVVGAAAVPAVSQPRVGQAAGRRQHGQRRRQRRGRRDGRRSRARQAAHRGVRRRTERDVRHRRLERWRRRDRGGCDGARHPADRARIREWQWRGLGRRGLGSGRDGDTRGRDRGRRQLGVESGRLRRRSGDARRDQPRHRVDADRPEPRATIPM